MKEDIAPLGGGVYYDPAGYGYAYVDEDGNWVIVEYRGAVKDEWVMGAVAYLALALVVIFTLGGAG